MNYAVLYLSYNTLFSVLTAEIEPQLIARHFSVQAVPDVVTDRSPHPGETYFHSSLVRLYPSDQSQIPISTADCK